MRTSIIFWASLFPNKCYLSRSKQRTVRLKGEEMELLE